MKLNNKLLIFGLFNSLFWFGNIEIALAQSYELAPTTNLNCPVAENSETFLVKKIEIVGKTVLQKEIYDLITPYENRQLTFEELLCLRTEITQLYIQNGYITSGAFLPNNQDITSGIVQIQVIEGEIENVEISGLRRLRQGYIRSRLAIGIDKPFNQNDLQRSLELLQLDPLLEQVNAELTVGSAPGRNILKLQLKEAPAFHAAIEGNNYRPPSIGSEQGTIFLGHDNLLGFGDRISGEYSISEGLNLYDVRYTVPINAYDGTISVRYYNSQTVITESLFRDLDISNTGETFTVGIRQPLYRSPQNEWAVGLDFDLRRSRSTLEGESFCLSLPCENGSTKLSILRFSQEWLNRDPNRIIAARSQFNFGIAAFDATEIDIEPDSQFFSWLGQFQWVQRITSRVLVVGRAYAQLTPDALPIIEQFSIGGIDTVRGYVQNQLVTDNALIASLEFRVPLTQNPSILQLTPFFEFGTGWNNLLPDPENSTLAGIGLGFRWFITNGLSIRLDYGVPLIPKSNKGNTLQDNGFYFSVRYQPF
ncbi:ShlB/FhaC/HecB family hemolysin secretion/activation protein [Aphanothece hegewaldii CCALA 016]|uniref:ShlB/FhaC/HecB family hemolysin secretion/activation protein n=1 Tax=Aphanothece hegewaldii CCALA 016 TaxID=2107694 RepID=A0A2T1LVB3_9CHRO|nr:ShlB/FhaC/HecB family hemolysin secretion/activation protein [Aphanothece hegewaldii]PSF35521.1 ShlB/FhaC/HecB family hemolysin secretion/activation protein [Aphanothece hegewaldii CCALA 016]